MAEGRRSTVEPLLSASARARMNGDWTSEEQIRRTRASLEQTQEFMKKFTEDTKARQYSRPVPKTPSQAAGQSILRSSFSPQRGIGARNPHPHSGHGFGAAAASAASGSDVSGLYAAPAAAAAPVPQAVKQFQSLVNGPTGQAATEGKNVVADLKQQIEDIKRSMNTYSMAGMTPPQFAPHPSVDMGAIGGAIGGPKFAQPNRKDAAGAALAAAASGGNPQVATEIATQLSAPNVLAGLSQLQTLLGQTQDLMKVMPGISNQIKSLKTDERYPTGWSMNLPWASDSISLDEYSEFKENYANACWSRIQGIQHWISAADSSVGQTIVAQQTTTNGVATITNVRAIPFHFDCMVFDSANDRLIVGGSRYVSGKDSNAQNGQAHWQPVVVAFDIATDLSLTVNATWFAEAQTSISIFTENWPGNGIAIVDIQINPVDSSLYLLMNCLSTAPSVNTTASSSTDFSSPASVFMVHMLSNAKLDNSFDMMSIPKFYVGGGSGGAQDSLIQGGNIGATGIRLLYSKAQSAVFVLLYKHKKGGAILVLSAITGSVQCQSMFDQNTYLRDLVLSPNEQILYVCGYEMTDVTKKASNGIVVAFQANQTPVSELKTFGSGGFVVLPYQDSDPSFRYTVAHRILMAGDDLLVFGNATKGGAADRLGLMAWALRPNDGAFISPPILFQDPDMSKASLVIASVIYDDTTKIVTISGGIRMSANQVNSTEIWIAQFDLLKAEIVSYHVPCTPDLFAQSKAIALVDSRIFFVGNMQVHQQLWGRQAFVSSIPAAIAAQSSA